MNPKPFPSITKPAPLIPTVKVCVLCNPGKQAENYVCPACEADLNRQPTKLDVHAIHNDVWSDLGECQNCCHKARFSDRTVICVVKPHACPAVLDAIDVVALTTSNPQVMADFMAECSDQLALAAAIVAECGNTELKTRLLPLIYRWVENQSTRARKDYVQKHYGNSQNSAGHSTGAKKASSLFAAG